MHPTPKKTPGRGPETFGPPELEEAGWLVDRALREDLPTGDATCRGLFRAGSVPSGDAFLGGTPREDVGILADFTTRADGVLCGLPVVRLLYERIDARVVLRAALEDGDRLGRGTRIAELRGPASSVLAGERIALNFLGRLSGIASTTSRWVRRIAGSSARLLDTRKTTPGWRHLEKYAVRVGGGTNHRPDLSTQAMVKDNHAAVLRARGVSSIAAWVEAIRRESAGIFVEVEVDSREEFLEARAAGPDAILLDNFPTQGVAWAVEANRSLAEPRPLLEASGGVTLERLSELAATGVDWISVGALTHSAAALDVSLEFRGLCRQEPSRGGPVP